MSKSLSEIVKHLLFPILLVVITGVISFLNYTHGTYLTGWDTLHPEFNFQQQLSNAFFGVFRTDQGLGAVAAHAHMVELPRIILLWIFSLVLPPAFLRYAFIFLCFILGPLGIYFFTKYTLRIHGQLSTVSCQLSAFLGALVYIFNLGTVQHFYVPFEMFAVQYAALGWIFLLALQFIELQRTKILLLFAAVVFLASPMAYASVLWYAYFAAFLLFLGTIFIIKRTGKVFLTSLLLIIITLAVNSYWILPNIYFLTGAATDISSAEVNKIFSDEAFLHNKEYGNIIDTALLKNFLFNWTQLVDANTFEDLMIDWKNHLVNPFVVLIGYTVFVVSVIGIFISIVKKNVIGIALTPIFLLALIMLTNMNPPFEVFFSFLRDNFPLLREGLRFPFTKFSLLLMFSMSVFFAITIAQILRVFEKIHLKLIKTASLFGLILMVVAALTWYGLPMLKGTLINPELRIAIPNEYFELFEYMGEKPREARIAPLPLHSPWGWEYYNWPDQNGRGGGYQYQGAGFLWFGLKQPVLARDFDRWNPSNEQYFREMSHALYSRDIGQVEALARKYRISYFLLDESIIFESNKQNALWHYETKDTFEKSANIKLERQFGNLYLYGVDKSLTGADFVQKPENITLVGPEITGGFVDIAAQNYGDYAVSDNPDFTYFSRSLVNRYDRVDPKNISFLDNTMIIKLGKNTGYNLTDSWLSNNIFPKFMRESYDLTIEQQGLPFIVGDEQFIFFPITASPIDVSAALEKSDDCKTVSERAISDIERYANFVSFRAKNAASCGFITFSSAQQDFGSMFILEARNQRGLPIRLCISENLTDRCSIYTALDSESSWKRYVFMIPPLPSGGSGYAVHFNTVGIGKDESINDIRYAQLIQIPYYRIANLSFVKDGYVPQANDISNLSARERNPSLYEISVSSSQNRQGFIALYKAYDEGWKAYKSKNYEAGIMNYANMAFPFVFGEEIKDHVKVNNWANGWLLNDESVVNGQLSIVIVYLPQYLEYVGFAIIISTLCLLGGIIGIKRIRNIKS